jgi:hypothetical protein
MLGGVKIDIDPDCADFPFQQLAARAAGSRRRRADRPAHAADVGARR